MDAAGILKKYGLDAPPAHEEFLRQLRRLPTYDRNWLFSPAPPVNALVQGDVIGPVTYVLTTESNEHALVEGDVMIVSNSCDAVPAQSPFAVVAPVMELETYAGSTSAEDPNWTNHLVALRKFEIDSFYYLPGWIQLPESFADFSRLTHLPSSYLKDSFDSDAVRRRASLSSKGHLLLLAKLAYFFVRLESEEIRRETEA
jgi:hypothetical protein